MGILDSQQETDPNKILPITYDWARSYYKKGVANNWTPEEIPMQDDVQQWNSEDELTEDERRVVRWNMGFFSTAESLTANNIVLAIYEHVRNPEARQYLLRQAFEEAIHTDMFIYCCDTLGEDPDEIYNMYNTIPSIKKKDDFVVDLTTSIFDKDFEIETTEDVQDFLRDIVGFYIIMEGIFFYAGFAMMLSLKRRDKMVGIGQQFEYVMRDESLHVGFGADLINTIVKENPEVWTEEFQQEIVELIKESVELEKEYAFDACPNGILGLRPDQFANYVEYMADRRLKRINLPEVYGTDNPFPWMSQQADLDKEKNFFETKVTEYQSGGSLDWE
ncbi:MAG: ribonucleotide-diphosphate reductase subunit beta [Candidatus Nanohaloarchaea archaeon]|nr:ribonucleotide-diphosphate reductase subunit beta [Candidatus Nanohaloarchaea archaeon]